MIKTSGILFQKKPNNIPVQSPLPRESGISQATQMESINEADFEATKESIKEEKIQKEQFEQLINRGTKVLYKISSVFPFAFFPSALVIDPEKVTVKIREFFFSSEIKSMYIKNIAQIFVDTGPFFATLTIVDQMIMNDLVTIHIHHLKKNEAMKARRIIQGLVISHKEKIDVAKIKDENLVNKLEDLGRMQ